DPSDPPPTYDDEHGSSAGTAPNNGGAPGAKRPPPPRGPLPLDIPVLNHLKGKRVILASKSPRRKQLLATIGLTNLEIVPSTKPENISKTDHTPFEYVLQTALQKCLSVYEAALETQLASIPDPHLVIAADTIIVTSSGAILEKPTSHAHHLTMLKTLRNQRMHRVYTAVAVLAPREDARTPGYNLDTTVEETRVFFDEQAGDELIEAYVRTREGADRAGGYAIQGMGGLLVEKIEGAWDTVVGLPVRATVGLIEKVLFDQE
ncbi:Maf-like protein-domain-containing protein, partial [Xylogone sp. PMI_703]